MERYYKGIIAFLASVGVVLGVLVANGVQTKWIVIALACVNAVGVLAVKNFNYPNWGGK